MSVSMVIMELKERDFSDQSKWSKSLNPQGFYQISFMYMSSLYGCSFRQYAYICLQFFFCIVASYAPVEAI